jgi:hypothetical protein
MAIVEVRFGKRRPIDTAVPMKDHILAIQRDTSLEKTLLSPGVHPQEYRIGQKKYDTTTVEVFNDGTAIYTRESLTSKPSRTDRVIAAESENISQVRLDETCEAAVYIIDKGDAGLGIQSVYYYVPGATPSEN